MAGKKPEKKSNRRKSFRWLFVFIGLGILIYFVSKKQKPGASVPAGGPDERIMIKDQEKISGLGSIMSGLVTQLLKEPGKVELLNDLNLTLAIEPVEQPETAITMTFSDGYVIFEPGVVESPDVKISCSVEVLMQIAGIGSGLDALKHLVSPDGRELLEKFFSGELKIEGLALHPLAMLKFTRLLAPQGA